MAKTLDFNKFNAPTLDVVLMDDAKTKVRITTPSEEMIEELQSNLPEMQKLLSASTADAIKYCYDLAARLMNFNVSFFRTTAEELRDKYNLKLPHIIGFYQAYLEYIEEIVNAKN